MKSELHQKLQDRAKEYLLSKSYWIKAMEMPTPIGIIDCWGISRSKNFDTCAIEVKVSRSDYRSKSQKYKEYNSTSIAERCLILCPANLIKENEVNVGWGLLWYYGDEERLRLVKHPLKLAMTDRSKLEILIHFLSNGLNNNSPKL